MTNATSDRRFFLTNPDSLFVTYDGLVVAVEKRRSSDWQASGSYAIPRAHGLQVISNGAADDPQFSTIARPGFLTFGQDPNDLTNAAGRLPNDCTTRFPRDFGCALALERDPAGGQPADLYWEALGRNDAGIAAARQPKSLLEPRGTRRLSSQSLLDVRVSKTLPIGAVGSADVILDVLNLLNDSAEEALVSDNLLSATFGSPSRFIDPRRVMLGVRLNLGR